MPHRRALAPLVGAGMAAVAAGSLVLFSLLAQEAALSPPAGDVVTPRERAAGEGGSEMTLPAPEENGADNGEVDLVPTRSFLPAPTDEAATTVAAEPDTTEENAQGSLFAVIALRMQDAATVDVEGPKVAVAQPEEPAGEDPGGDDDCPGRPNKDREHGEHPHGGPPACGNPHGAPPGYDKNDSVDPGSGSHEDTPGNSGGASNGGGSSDNGGHPHGGPPGHESTPPKGGSPSYPPAGDGGDDGSDDYEPPSGHPHGGPPGQTKKEGSDDSGHPHGEPPGQAKKDK